MLLIKRSLHGSYNGPAVSKEKNLRADLADSSNSRHDVIGFDENQDTLDPEKCDECVVYPTLGSYTEKRFWKQQKRRYKKLAMVLIKTNISQRGINHVCFFAPWVFGSSQPCGYSKMNYRLNLDEAPESTGGVHRAKT